MIANINTVLQPEIQRILAGDGDLTTALGGTFIYYTSAPQNAQLPYIIYNILGVLDNETPQHNWTKDVEIRTYSSNAGSVDVLFDLASKALTGGTITMDDYGCYWCEYNNDAPLIPYLEEDKTITYSGGGYFTVRISENL